MPDTYTTTIPIIIPSRIIADVMVTAFEGGINYWCGRAELVRGESLEKPWYADRNLYDQDFEIKLHDAEGPDTWLLTPDSLRRGLKLLDTQILLRIRDEEYDADDADSFLQLSLFGEIVYG